MRRINCALVTRLLCPGLRRADGNRDTSLIAFLPHAGRFCAEIKFEFEIIPR